MMNIYYSRKMPNGAVRTVGPFPSVLMARRYIGRALVDNGYERTPDQAAPFVALFTWSTNGPYLHAGSGVTYMVHTGADAPDALASPPATP